METAPPPRRPQFLFRLIETAYIRGFDRALSEGYLLGLLASAWGRFVPGIWPRTEMAWVIGALWAVCQLVTPTQVEKTPSLSKGLARLLVEIGILAGIVATSLAIVHHPIVLPHGILMIWSTVAIGVLRQALRNSDKTGSRSSSETLRWMVLLSAGYWLFQPLFTPIQQGAGDSRWYGTLLADMLTQVRAGIFPVFLGQSEYQFNGSVYPIRVAPGFQYLGGLVDILTGQCLPVFTVQNLLLALVGISALFCTYFCLVAVSPGKRWGALMLALLFIGCPGVVGVVYNSDLYMSWMTLPFIPLVFTATVRSFERVRSVDMMPLGGALGSMFWGHSPIALWTTAAAGAAQMVRIIASPRRSLSRAHLRAYAVGAAVFAFIGGFPLGSVLFFPLENGVKIADLQGASVHSIVYFIRQVYPQTFRPLSALARQLSDFQLGYALWGVLAVGGVVALARRKLSTCVLILLSSAVTLLLTPVFGIEERLWSVVPSFLRNPLGNWAMNRLYVLLAAMTVFAVIDVWPTATTRKGKILDLLAYLTVLHGIVWSS